MADQLLPALIAIESAISAAAPELTRVYSSVNDDAVHPYALITVGDHEGAYFQDTDIKVTVLSKPGGEEPLPVEVIGITRKVRAALEDQVLTTTAGSVVMRWRSSRPARLGDDGATWLSSSDFVATTTEEVT